MISLSLKDFERILFRCSEEDVSKYPQASQEEILQMESDFINNSDSICIYPFVRKPEGGNPYVEIYIWDIMLFPNIYERFNIYDGMQLPDKMEKKLLYYCRENLSIDRDSMESFNSALAESFPQWNYIPYSADAIGQAIEHIYYASHRSGPREILYKAGMENIAYNLDKLPEVNLIGSTPSSIIAHDFPIKLLHILNQPELIDTLYEKKRAEHALEVYKKYAGFIGRNIPSANQWRYLDELYCNGGKFSGMKFNRTLYNRLEYTHSKGILNAYAKYFELFEELKIEKRMRIPKADELQETTEKLELLREYSVERTDLDVQLKRRKHLYGPTYEYSDDTYIVAMPSTCADMCKEAICQENCLMEYVDRHASGKTTILFLRKKNKPNIPYVTIEVKNSQITQVYGYCNTRPEKEVYQFLIGKYLKDKSFSMDLQPMIDNYLDDNDEIDSKLLDYFFTFMKRNTSAQDHCEYIQLTLEDLFPDLFDK